LYKTLYYNSLDVDVFNDQKKFTINKVII